MVSLGVLSLFACHSHDHCSQIPPSFPAHLFHYIKCRDEVLYTVFFCTGCGSEIPPVNLCTLSGVISSSDPLGV